MNVLTTEEAIRYIDSMPEEMSPTMERAAMKRLSEDYKKLATEYGSLAPKMLELINQCAIAEAQLVEVQYFLRRWWAKKNGRAVVATAEEIAKIEGGAWMLKVLTEGLDASPKS